MHNTFRLVSTANITVLIANLDFMKIFTLLTSFNTT